MVLGWLGALCLAATGHWAMAAQQEPESLRVGLVHPERPPYFWRHKPEGELAGIYIDLLEALGKATGITFSYHFYPQARLRLYMLRGELDLEPGIDSDWRQAPGERAQSVYTSPFMQSEEVLVFSPQRYLADAGPAQLATLSGCVVLGFNPLEYENEASGGWQKVVTEEQILGMLEKDRCHYAVMPTWVLQFFEKRRPLAIRQSGPVASYVLRLCLGRQHAHLVPLLNAALARMKADGRLDAILNKYR